MEAHHIQRELWRWLMQDEKSPKKESGAIVCITHLDEGEWPKLDWKTFSRRDPKLREPIASWQVSGSTQAPPPEPLTQEQMREQVDSLRYEREGSGRTVSQQAQNTTIVGHSRFLRRECRQRISCTCSDPNLDTENGPPWFQFLEKREAKSGPVLGGTLTRAIQSWCPQNDTIF